MFQLETASAGKGLGIAKYDEATIFRNESTGFIGNLIVNPYFTRQDNGTGFFSCRDEFFFTNN